MRILVADSHDQVRSALRLLLEQEGAVEVIGEAHEEGSLLDTVGEFQPDLLLLDWSLLGTQPEERVAALQQRRPQLAIVVLSSRPEARQAAADAGVEHFVSKSAFAEELLATLVDVRRRQVAGRQRVELNPHGV